MRRAKTALLGALLGLGCAGLPHPTPEDLTRAQARYPGATQASLEEGRSAFVSDCSGCHALPLPPDHTPADWPNVVRTMAERGGISEHDRALIEQFLVTLAARSTPAAPPR